MRLRSVETSVSPSSERTVLQQLSKIAPSDGAVIGFVTSGNYSLSRGKGYAIGAISLVRFLEIQEQAHRQVVAHISSFLCTTYCTLCV